MLKPIQVANEEGFIVTLLDGDTITFAYPLFVGCIHGGVTESKVELVFRNVKGALVPQGPVSLSKPFEPAPETLRKLEEIWHTET